MNSQRGVALEKCNVPGMAGPAADPERYLLLTMTDSTIW